MCAYQGIRNVSFSKNFAYILNERSQERPGITFMYVILFSACIGGFQEENNWEAHQSKLLRYNYVVWSKISRVCQTGLYSFKLLLKVYIFCVEANLFGYICSFHQLYGTFSITLL